MKGKRQSGRSLGSHSGAIMMIAFLPLQLSTGVFHCSFPIARLRRNNTWARGTVARTQLADCSARAQWTCRAASLSCGRPLGLGLRSAPCHSEAARAEKASQFELLFLRFSFSFLRAANEVERRPETGPNWGAFGPPRDVYSNTNWNTHWNTLEHRQRERQREREGEHGKDFNA